MEQVQVCHPLLFQFRGLCRAPRIGNMSICASLKTNKIPVEIVLGFQEKSMPNMLNLQVSNQFTLQSSLDSSMYNLSIQNQWVWLIHSEDLNFPLAFQELQLSIGAYYKLVYDTCYILEAHVFQHRFLTLVQVWQYLQFTSLWSEWAPFLLLFPIDISIFIFWVYQLLFVAHLLRLLFAQVSSF